MEGGRCARCCDHASTLAMMLRYQRQWVGAQLAGVHFVLLPSLPLSHASSPFDQRRSCSLTLPTTFTTTPCASGSSGCSLALKNRDNFSSVTAAASRDWVRMFGGTGSAQRTLRALVCAFSHVRIRLCSHAHAHTRHAKTRAACLHVCIHVVESVSVVLGWNDVPRKMRSPGVWNLGCV